MVKKSYAKVNIFLKIAGKRDNFHEIVSRFIRVKNLYDIISFDEGKFEKFTLVGNFGCGLKKNTIYKAYEMLKKKSSNVEKYFQNHCVIVDKSIPEFAGLGGGSSNAATFMLMVNEACNLKFSKSELINMACKIGLDIPFFICEYDSANVTGIGEIVQRHDEQSLDIEVISSQIQCNTAEVFKVFRNKFYKELSKEDKNLLLKLDSKEILKKFNIHEANDLYIAACEIYPQLNQIDNTKLYFSGSGSSFFKVK